MSVRTSESASIKGESPDDGHTTRRQRRPASHSSSDDPDTPKPRQRAETTGKPTTPSQKTLRRTLQPGMRVEARNDALGEEDLSKPTVSAVRYDENGNVEGVEVKKGVVFRKTIEVPAERITDVAAPTDDPQDNGSVTVAATAHEVAALSATGVQELPPTTKPTAPHDKLDKLHKRQHSASVAQPTEITAQADAKAARRDQQQHASRGASRGGFRTKARALWRLLGPGFLSGMAGNDSSAVASYAIDGATAGYAHLWLVVVSTPLLLAVQVACGQMGRVTKKGLNTLLRERFGRKVSLPATVILLVANTGLIAANLVAIGEGLQLLTGVYWAWFVVPVAAALWYITVYQSFGVIKNIFLLMSLVFVAYIVTGFFSGARLGTVLLNTVTPQLTFSFASVSSAVALLGATISPYTMFWQAEGEREAHRPGALKQQLRSSRQDIGAGVISGNLVAYFIIVCASATLYTHHQTIQTAADAARALQPLLGPYATYLFAIGFIGAGLVAIPVLLASTSYAVSNAFGWPASLWRKPWQSEGFYLILSVALVVGLIIALIGVNPISLIFWANVLQGTLAPVLVALLFFLGMSRRALGAHRLGRLTLLGLAVATALMFAATGLLFYGLATGQGG